MKIKKTRYYNEKEEAERVLKEGLTQTGYVDSSKMYLLAKYLRFILGYGETRIEKELISMARQQDKNFNPVSEALSIKRWIRAAMKSEFMPQTSEIKLYKGEIDFLNSIEDLQAKKLLFAMLVSAKVKAEQYKMARLTVTYEELDSLVGSAGLTEPQAIIKLNKYKSCLNVLTRYERIVLLFGELSGRAKEKINPNRYSEEFSRIFPESKFTCNVCGKSFSYKSKKRPKYCTGCAVDVDRQKSRERWKKKTSI